jgi:hypothetical protein
MIARPSHLAWFTCIVVAVGVAFLIYDSLRPKLSREQQWSLNSLDNYLLELEKPTADNKTTRALACVESEFRAAQFRKLPVSGIERKVQRYLDACARVEPVEAVERMKRAWDPDGK